MKYHIHLGPYGSRGEARTIYYRDERGRDIASYTFSEAWGGMEATDWVTLYSAPNTSGHLRRLPHEEGKAERICQAWLSELGFTEHDQRADTADVRSYCD